MRWLTLTVVWIPLAGSAHYLRPPEVEARLRQIQAAAAGRARVVEIGRSRAGRPILALVVGRSRHRALFLGLHHAREWASADLVLGLAEHFARARGARAKRLARSREAWFVPLVNPDGYALSFRRRRRMWRKNTRDNDGDGRVGSGDGVDLNRNYDYRWQSSRRARRNPFAPEYRGPAPFSEPETRAIRDLVLGRHFSFAVSYHAFGSYLVYPEAAGGLAREPVDAPIFQALAGSSRRPAIRSSFRLEPDGQAERYRVHYGSPETGSRFDTWAYHRAGVLSFYVELHDGFRFRFPADLKARRKLVEDNLPFAADVLEAAGRPTEARSHLGRRVQAMAHVAPEVARGSAAVLLGLTARRDLGRPAIFYFGDRGVGWLPMKEVERGVYFSRYEVSLPIGSGGLWYYFAAGGRRLPEQGSFRLAHEGHGGELLFIAAEPDRWRGLLEGPLAKATLWSRSKAPPFGTVLRAFRHVLWEARPGEGAVMAELAPFVRSGGRVTIVDAGALRPPRRRAPVLRRAPGLPPPRDARQSQIEYLRGDPSAPGFVRRSLRELTGLNATGHREAVRRVEIEGRAVKLEARRKLLALGRPAGATVLASAPARVPWGCARGCYWSGRESDTLTRLSRRIDRSGIAEARLRLHLKWDLEPFRDFAFVEARGGDGRWTTVAVPGRTTSKFGPDPRTDPDWLPSWVRLRAPGLLRYVTPPRPARALWRAKGAEGTWNALSGQGEGWLDFSLPGPSKIPVDVSVAYLADPAKVGRGVVLRGAELWDGERRVRSLGSGWETSTAIGTGRWRAGDDPQHRRPLAVRSLGVTVATLSPFALPEVLRRPYLRVLLGQGDFVPAPSAKLPNLLP